MPSPYLQIRTSVLVHNLQLLQNSYPEALLAPVIKANAYGLGVQVVLPTLKAFASHFFVFSLSEAIELRQLNPTATIYVLEGYYGQGVDFLHYQLIPIIESKEHLESWYQDCPHSPYGLAIDTGMSRLGIRYDSIHTLSLQHPPTLLLSHFATADNPNHPLTHLQIERFNQVTDYYLNLNPSMLVSFFNSDAALNHYTHFKHYARSIIRVGIHCYRNSLSLHAPLLQKRQVYQGESIGYGATFVANRNLTVGIFAFGYADGFHRLASSNGFNGIINGIQVPLLGRVSMDSSAFDLSNLPHYHNEDLTLFDAHSSSLESYAQACGTLNYEVLCHLGSRVKKILLP